VNYKKINELYPFNYHWNVGKPKYFFRDESILFIVTMGYFEKLTLIAGISMVTRRTFAFKSANKVNASSSVVAGVVFLAFVYV